VTSAVALLVGASGVFVELRYALDAIHGTERGRDGFVSWFVRGRLWSMALVLAVGFLMLVSLIASAMIAAMGSWLTIRFPVIGFVAIVLNLLLSLAVLTGLFGMLMRWLPSEREPWREVWSGALLSSALLEAGKELLGLYLGAPRSRMLTAPPAVSWCWWCGSTTRFRCSCLAPRSTRSGNRNRIGE
jgi:membrane protein